MKKRSGNLDLMKFLFSVMIVIYHGKNLATGGPILFPGGSAAVEFFFLVSGVLMARTASKTEIQGNLGKDTLAFVKHKISGLMPNYYVAFVIAFIVSHLGATSLFLLFKDAIYSVWELLLVTGVGLRPIDGLANGAVWYLSAMLLAMFVIWPIMRKCKDLFFYWIAPIAVLLIMGITYQNWTRFGAPSLWTGVCFRGTIRAFMGILLGCIAYKVAEFIKRQEFTLLSKSIFSLVELVGYMTVFVICMVRHRGTTDWAIVAILAVCVTITFSDATVWADRFRHPVFNRLGVFSYSLYLGHGYWSNALADLLPKLTYWQRMPIYLLISFATGLFIHFVSIGLRRLWAAKGTQIKRMFISG